MSTTLPSTLPILDLARLNAGPVDRAAFLDHLRYAARDIGFFYVVNHGVDTRLLEDVQREARQFFALPEEEKAKVAMIHSPHFRGYNRAAAELTRGKPDWREQFDIGAERPALALSANAPSWRRLQGPNLWPAAQPSLRPTLLRFQRDMAQMALRLLRAFAEALQLAPDAFDTLYGEQPNEHIKLIRYPGQQRTGSNQGVGAHKDSGFLSFLLQDAQKGLQVEVAPDEWIDAAPLPGSFVVNIGELLELATNGYLRATVHRVVSRPRITNASLSPFSSARGSTAWCRSIRCRRSWRVRRTARRAIRATRFCVMSAGTISKAACARTLMSPNVTTAMCCAKATN